MKNRRFIAFLAILTALLSGAVLLTQYGSEDKTVCPPGEEAIREFTTNKTRKLVCKKVRVETDVENR